MTATTAEAAQRPRSLNDVKGWFPSLDQVLFDFFLRRQERLGEHGDLLEMGAYMGKSAIFTAAYLRAGERFTVCDLFDAEDAPDENNAAEARKSYSTLTRTAFEQNYLAFHDELPHIIQGTTSVVPSLVDDDTCRFVHVDASHLYEHVEGDIGAARDVLLPGGIVVLDDFRSEHTPGVSVATWEAVLNRGLRPICLSTQKLYGTWGDPQPVQEELLAMLRDRTDVGLSVQEAAGHCLVRTRAQKGMQPPFFPRSRYYTAPEQPTSPTPAPATAPAAPAVSARRRPRSRVRRIGVDLLPPIVTRAIRRALAPGAQAAPRRPSTR